MAHCISMVALAGLSDNEGLVGNEFAVDAIVCWIDCVAFASLANLAEDVINVGELIIGPR